MADDVTSTKTEIYDMYDIVNKIGGVVHRATRTKN
jgi:hypothetical protein